jgi:hypothetical protein
MAWISQTCDFSVTDGESAFASGGQDDGPAARPCHGGAGRDVAHVVQLEHDAGRPTQAATAKARGAAEGNVSGHEGGTANAFNRVPGREGEQVRSVDVPTRSTGRRDVRGGTRA